MWWCTGRQSNMKITLRCVIILWCSSIALWVCVSMSCFISTQRCEGAWPYRCVSSTSYIPSSLSALEIINTDTRTHPNKADQRKCSKTVQYIHQWHSLMGEDGRQCVVTHPGSWYRWISGCRCCGPSGKAPSLTCGHLERRACGDNGFLSHAYLCCATNGVRVSLLCCLLSVCVNAAIERCQKASDLQLNTAPERTLCRNMQHWSCCPANNCLMLLLYRWREGCLYFLSYL